MSQRLCVLAMGPGQVLVTSHMPYAFLHDAARALLVWKRLRRSEEGWSEIRTHLDALHLVLAWFVVV